MHHRRQPAKYEHKKSRAANTATRKDSRQRKKKIRITSRDIPFFFIFFSFPFFWASSCSLMYIHTNNRFNRSIFTQTTQPPMHASTRTTGPGPSPPGKTRGRRLVRFLPSKAKRRNRSGFVASTVAQSPRPNPTTYVRRPPTWFRNTFWKKRNR